MLFAQETEKGVPRTLPMGQNTHSPKVVQVSPSNSSKERFQQSVSLEITGNYEFLSNNFRPWSAANAQVLWSIAKHTKLYATLHVQERFALQDISANIGISYPITQWLVATAEVNASPTARIVPLFALYGQLQCTLGNGVVLGGGYRYSRFTPVAASMIMPGLEWYKDAWRFAYSAYLTTLNDNARLLFSNAAQISYYWSDDNVLTISGTIGTEGFLLSPSVVQVFDIAGIYLIGRYGILPKLALTHEFLWQRQGNLFDRFGVQVGLRYTF